MQSAFGVEHGYVSKASPNPPYNPSEKRQIRSGGIATGAVTGLFGGGVATSGIRVGGYMAHAKAGKMYQQNRQAQNKAANVSDAFKGNPHYQKWSKVQNLADRASSPGEKAAAQGMADKISAAHGPFTPPKVKPLGAGYRTMRRVARLQDARIAAPLGFGLATAGGVALGVHAAHKEVAQNRARKAARAARQQAKQAQAQAA